MVNAVFGAGDFLGAAFSASRSGENFYSMVLSVFLLSITFISMYYASNFYIITITLFFMGFFNSIYMTLTSTQISLRTSDLFQIRILSFYSYIVTGTNLFGALLIGLIIKYTGSLLVFLVAGIVALFAAIYGFLNTANERLKEPSHKEFIT